MSKENKVNHFPLRDFEVFTAVKIQVGGLGCNTVNSNTTWRHNTRTSTLDLFTIVFTAEN